jgi:hypothetical protein
LRFAFFIHVDFVTWLSIYFAVMLPALLLTFAALLYRLLFILAGAPVDWANFSPLASLFLCSGLFFSIKRAVLLPALGLLVSDVVINAHYHAPLIDTRMIPGYFCFGMIFLLGTWLRHRHITRPIPVLLAAVSSSILFYFVTNTIDWYFDAPLPLSIPLYSKTFAGWLQALTVGHPGFPPTYLFLRNTVLSDLLFTSLFLLTQALLRPHRASSDLPGHFTHPTV